MSVRVFLTGGLGNQMFQYAAGRALALRSGQRLQIDLSSYSLPQLTGVPRPFELDAFALPVEVEKVAIGVKPYLFLRRLAASFPSTSRSLLGLHFEANAFGFESLDQRSRFYALFGYFQDPAYFEDVATVLREEFCTLRFFGAQAHALRDMILTSGEAVCVHVRRGDYVSHSGSAAFHGVSSVEYYKRAVTEMRTSFPRASFFVFSDDIEWCRGSMPFLADAHFVPPIGLDSCETLMCMAACQHFIIANSTFSWWAAWLGGGQNKFVVAPARWACNVETQSIGLGSLATSIL